MPDIDTILFDLDGTLADTAPDLADALNRLLHEHGRPPLSYGRVRGEVSHGARALIRLGFDLQPGDPGFDAHRNRFLELYRDRICDRTTLFPGMRAVLDGLHARGLSWGVVTNKPAAFTDLLIDRLGLADEAVCVVSGDTTANSKPHPEPILHACRLAGCLPAECLYVGDAERDIEAGRRAGTRTLTALFGYLRDHDDPLAWGADAAVRTPGEILTWLDEFNREVAYG